MKIKLSPIKQVKIRDLKINKKNVQYFKYQDEKKLETLIEDIAKRGILVPLIAKKNGMLLAGHSRLKAAKKLKMETVPVQFVADHLTEGEETAFLIKDNALRRHMNRDARKIIYYRIYPDFDTRIMLSGKTNGINLKRISEETGLSYNTLNSDLVAFRKWTRSKKNKSDSTVNAKAVDTFQRNMARLLNTAMFETAATLDSLIDCTRTVLDRLNSIKELHKAKSENSVLAKKAPSLFKEKNKGIA